MISYTFSRAPASQETLIPGLDTLVTGRQADRQDGRGVGGEVERCGQDQQGDVVDDLIFIILAVDYHVFHLENKVKDS